MLVGFPSGFTSESYRIAWQSLPYLKYSRYPDGEVLNHQRKPKFWLGKEEKFHFWLAEDHQGFRASSAWVFKKLHHYSEGYIVKDVVHPYEVLEYLKKYPNKYRVLYVRRNPEEVRFFIEKKGWNMTLDLSVLDQHFRRFTTLNVDQALKSEEYFHSVLKSLYANARFVKYITPTFEAKREDRKAQFENHRAKIS